VGKHCNPFGLCKFSYQNFNIVYWGVCDTCKKWRKKWRMDLLSIAMKSIDCERKVIDNVSESISTDSTLMLREILKTYFPDINARRKFMFFSSCLTFTSNDAAFSFFFRMTTDLYGFFLMKYTAHSIRKVWIYSTVMRLLKANTWIFNTVKCLMSVAAELISVFLFFHSSVQLIRHIDNKAERCRECNWTMPSWKG
jgi:hypothetical protein